MSLLNILNNYTDMKNSPYQIFLVDDSVSMKPHRKQLSRALRVLGYLLKRGEVDPNRMFKLFFSSSTASAVNIQKSNRLQVAVEDHSFVESKCGISLALGDIVSSVIEQDKPASIYVLTNGHWDSDQKEDSCGVELPVGRLTKHIIEGSKDNNWAVIQFIRFYDVTNLANLEDLRGQDRLNFLSNHLTAKLRYKL